MSVLSQRAPPAQKKTDDRLILFAIAVIMGLLILLSAIASRASYRPGAAWTNPDEELFSKIKYPAFSGISKIQNTRICHCSERSRYTCRSRLHQSPVAFRLEGFASAAKSWVDGNASIRSTRGLDDTAQLLPLMP